MDRRFGVGGFEDAFSGPLQLYEDQTLFTKLYLATPVLFSSHVWLDYRQHAASCVSVSHNEGEYAAMRESFLDWFRSYIASRPIPGRERVERAMRRAEWGLAHPLAERVRRRLRSALALETA